MKIRLLRLFEHMGVNNIEIHCVESLRSNTDLTVDILKNSQWSYFISNDVNEFFYY